MGLGGDGVGAGVTDGVGGGVGGAGRTLTVGTSFGEIVGSRDFGTGLAGKFIGTSSPLAGYDPKYKSPGAGVGFFTGVAHAV